MRYWRLFLLIACVPFCSLSSFIDIECYDCEDNPDFCELSKTFHRAIKHTGLINGHSICDSNRRIEFDWNYHVQGGGIQKYSNFIRCDNFADTSHFVDSDETPSNFVEYDLLNYAHFAEACSYAYSDLQLLYEHTLTSYKNSLEAKKNDKNKGLLDLQTTTRAIENCKEERAKRELLAHKNWLEKLIPSLDRAINEYEEKLKETKENYPKNIDRLQKAEKKVNRLYDLLFSWCIEHHDTRGAYYQRGLQQFYLGRMEDAVDDIAKFIDLVETHAQSAALQNAHFFSGKMQAEMGLYHDAINTLSKVIESDPSSKEAYLERAFAYFETGDFSLSLNDFITSDYKRSQQENKTEREVDYAAGLIAGGLVAGSLQGTAQAVAEMPYLVFDSLRGLSHALWSATCKPSEISKELISACQNCVDYVRDHSTTEIIADLAPEMQTLVANFEQLNDYQKGELVGTALGKYGVGLFSGAGVLKCMKSYRDLQRANNLLTLQACTASEANAAAIMQEATKRWQLREAVCKNANLKIQADKQGKHIAGHKNYEEPRKRSILEHPDPQTLANKYAGTGVKVAGETPGTPGYGEIVNFEEFIGYTMDRETGIKTPTTYGKIHYAKDGVHIVPTHPRGE